MRKLPPECIACVFMVIAMCVLTNPFGLGMCSNPTTRPASLGAGSIYLGIVPTTRPVSLGAGSNYRENEVKLRNDEQPIRPASLGAGLIYLGIVPTTRPVSLGAGLN